MEAWIKIFSGLLFLFLSVGYLYRPVWILKVNVLGRVLFFNDTHLLLFRRRLGILLFLAAGLFLYSGLNNLAYQRAASSMEMWSAYRLLVGQQYKRAIGQCENLLRREPGNVQAWSLLGSAWAALGDDKRAAQAWEQGLRLSGGPAGGEEEGAPHP